MGGHPEINPIWSLLMYLWITDFNLFANIKPSCGLNKNIPEIAEMLLLNYVASFTGNSQIMLNSISTARLYFA